MTGASRYDKGKELLNACNHDAWNALKENVADVCPDLGRFVAEWAYADVWAREGLDLKTRQLVTLACLTTLGGSELQIQSHTTSALSFGLEPSEIVEAILQCLPYVGFPRVLNATSAIRAVFERESRLPVDY